MSVRRDDGVVLSGLNGCATPPGLCAAGGTGAGACRAAHARPRGAEDAQKACEHCNIPSTWTRSRGSA